MRFMRDLSPETQRLLRRCYKESQHHRVRQRAHCILLSCDGKTTKELMHIFDVERLTIYHWFNAWESRHFAGLYDHAGPWTPAQTDGSRARASTPIYCTTSSKYEEGCPSDRTRDL